ncbi:MAG: Xaa-Pro aminopeptidase, partial [Acidobacteriota bacterium]
LKLALDRANGVADIFMKEFQSGRTGKAIVTSAMQKAADAGLRPLIYSHPLGVHGHAAGCTMEARPPQSAPEGIEDNMTYPLHINTVYVVEFSSTTSVPEWDGQDVRIGFEEDVVFTKAGCFYVDGHQKKLLLIR